jgi:putative nucleotidyltransferase-like protein
LKETKQDLVASIPELGLLFLCRSDANAEEAAQFRARILETVDLDSALKLAGRHGLEPLLCWNLQLHCPEAADGAFHERFKSNAVRNLVHMQELLRILRCLESASIRAIPYKGPVLALSVYKNLALREFFDLDILVDVADVPRATEVLIAKGYRCQTQLTPPQLRSYLSSGCELCFEGNGVAVELHWRIAPRMYSFPFGFSDLWERRQTLEFGEQAIATLSPEDLLLVLCVHAMKHCWNSLCWVMDVAELLRTTLELDWRLVMQRASDIGAKRVLLLGLALAHELLSAPLPESVEKTLREDRALIPLLARAKAKLASPNPGAEFSLADHVFFLRARERALDKARYIFHALFTPEITDWRSTDSQLWPPMYRVTRFWRVLKKFAPVMFTQRSRPARLESTK